MEKQERQIEALESQVGVIQTGRLATSKVGSINTTQWNVLDAFHLDFLLSHSGCREHTLIKGRDWRILTWMSWRGLGERLPQSLLGFFSSLQSCWAVNGYTLDYHAERDCEKSTYHPSYQTNHGCSSYNFPRYYTFCKSCLSLPRTSIELIELFCCGRGIVWDFKVADTDFWYFLSTYTLEDG